MSMKSGVEVFVFKGGRFLGSRCYGQSTIVIGRGSDATLKLKDPTVSKRHAIVRVEGNNVVVADNHSEAGVYVNGTQVTMRAVTSFDEIAVGPFKLKLQLLGVEEDGFGDSDVNDVEPTQVRRSPLAAAQPQPAQAATPRLDPRSSQPPADDQWGAPAARSRPSGSRLGDPAAEFDNISTRNDGLAAQAVRARQTAGGAYGQPSAPATLDEPTASRGGSDFEDFESATTSAGAVARSSAQYDDVTDPHAGRHDRGAASSRSHAAPEEPEPAPAPRAAAPQRGEDYDPYWHDDDDDDEYFAEPFSLLENIVRERFKAPADVEGFAMVEVIRYGEGEIVDLLRADPGQTVRIGSDDFRLVNVHDDGRAQLFFREKMGGTIVSGGKARPLKRLLSDKYLVYPKHKIYGVELSEGDYAQLINEGSGYLVRFVRPPTVPKTQFRVNWNWANLQMFAGSAAFHFLLLVLLGFIAPEADLREVTDAERFAKISVKDLKLEKPKEKKKEEKPKEKKPKPKQDKPKPVKQKVVRRRAPRRTPVRRVSKQVVAKQKAAVQKKQVKNVLSALQNLKPKSGPGRADLSKLASNIAAIRTPGGTSSSFKVSGVIKKLPGGGVRLAGGGGGGGKDTKVGSQLLRGVGKLRANTGTGTRVRGRVRRAPTRTIRATGGHLSRAEIQKVVSRHMAQVQACYERQLITSPGLAGKIVFDWVITPGGGVGSARQARSSLRSASVSQCILRLIRRWRFPKPVGGSVQVRYPFVFRVSGF